MIAPTFPAPVSNPASENATPSAGLTQTEKKTLSGGDDFFACMRQAQDNTKAFPAPLSQRKAAPQDSTTSQKKSDADDSESDPSDISSTLKKGNSKTAAKTDDGVAANAVVPPLVTNDAGLNVTLAGNILALMNPRQVLPPIDVKLPTGSSEAGPQTVPENVSSSGGGAVLTSRSEPTNPSTNVSQQGMVKPSFFSKGNQLVAPANPGGIARIAATDLVCDAQSKAVAPSPTDSMAKKNAPAISAGLDEVSKGGANSSPSSVTAIIAEPTTGSTAQTQVSLNIQLQRAVTQVADNEAVDFGQLTSEVGVNPSGTASASQTGRMKFASETTAIAERPGQKALATSEGSDVSEPMTAKAVKPAVSALGQKKGSADDSQANLNSFGKPALVTPAEFKAPEIASTTTTTSLDRIEKVGQLIMQQVGSFQQSGADKISVSLKIDSQTELHLQITNQNGQIQALLRCDKGDASSLNAHFGDLQNSLARQNVQLLPMEGQRVNQPAPASFVVQSSASASQNDFSQHSRQQQSNGNRSLEEPELASSLKSSSPTTGTGSNRSTSNKTSRRDGWETWA